MTATEIIEGKYEAVMEYYSGSVVGDFFQFCLSYTDPVTSFGEIDRFLWESRRIMTRFKNRYDGPVLVDLTSYNDRAIHEYGEYFDAFMYFLRGNEGYLVTFFVEGDCSDGLREALERHFLLKQTKLTSAPRRVRGRTVGFTFEDREEV